MAERISGDSPDALAPVRESAGAMAADIESMFRMAMDGLVRFQADWIELALERGRRCGPEAERLTATLAAAGEGERASARGWLSIVNRLKMLGGACEDFCETALLKLREGALFSDEAFAEIERLHADVNALLHDSVRGLAEGNAASEESLEERGLAVEEKIRRSVGAHEARLIEGACAVRSSAVFLDMLDSLRRVASHAVDLARVRSRRAG